MTTSTPPQIPEDVIAVAVDANAMPFGRLDVAQIVQLAIALEQQELDAQIWVPEPVVWEWAEHALADLRKTRKPYQDALLRAKRAGIEGLPDHALDGLDIEQVVKQIEAALGRVPAARILLLKDHPEAAISGLRDQVLLTGPAKRKGGSADDSGVKTGASDSASFRLIKHEAAEDLSNVAVVSADRDLSRYFNDCPSPTIVADLHQAKRGVLAIQSGTHAAKLAVRSAVHALLGQSEAEILHLVAAEVRKDIVGDELRPDVDYFDISYELSAVRLDEIGEIEVSRTDKYATVDVAVELDMDVIAAWYNDYVEQVDHTYVALVDVPARLELSAQFDGSWRITVDRLVVE